MILQGPLERRLLPAAIVLALLGVVCHGPVNAQNRAGGWVDERRAGTFHCRANFSLDAYEGLFGQLAELQNHLTRVLSVEPAREPVELYLFADKTAYHRYLKAHMPQVTDRRALFVKGAGPGKVFVYRSKELAVDVRHESTHALLHAWLPMVPLWLDEGLAEYFEVPSQERPFREDYLDKLKWNIRLGTITRLVQLEGRRQLAEMSEADYRYAWAWVHFMLHGPAEAHDELVAFLADIHARIPPGRLSERLERRLPGIDRRLVEHLKAWNSRRPAVARSP
ncbi:MAG: DUF1570 domain-containing protein [Pirellulales bacterium]